LLEVPLAANCWREVRSRFSDVDPVRLVPELIRDMIGLMVNDVLQETSRRVAAAGRGDERRCSLCRQRRLRAFRRPWLRRSGC
jgi:hypothetical protein